MMASENRNGTPQPKTVEQWAAIAGRWEFQGTQATYLGPESAEKGQSFGIALAALQVRDGQINTRVKLSRREGTSAGVVLGYQSLGASYVAVTLGSFDRAYVVIESRPGFGFSPLDSAGSIANLDIDKTYDLNVTVMGQSVRLTVNQVEVLKTVLPRPLEGTGVGLYAWDDATVTFAKTDVTAVKPIAFVIMPFSEPFDSLYRDVIMPIAKSCGFEIIRIDEVPGPGIILNDIQQQIQRANVVVAEISTPNPNVFYELGYAHALDKPAVLLVRREHASQMPFDVRGYRAIFYDDSIAGKNVVERNLEQNFRAVLPGTQGPPLGMPLTTLPT
jgi:hypothetical protein